MLAALSGLVAACATPPPATGDSETAGQRGPTLVGRLTGEPPPAPAPPVALAELRRESQRSAARQAEEALRGGSGLSASRPVAVAAVLASDEEPRGDEATFSLVLAERGPRAEALCQAMLERMDLIDLQQAARARFPRRPVYWMVTSTGNDLDALRDVSCTEMVGRLDVMRAQALGLGGVEGPILVAESRRNGQIWTMRWDLSALPPGEFVRATRIWTELLTGDPAAWDARVGVIRWRETARAILIRYGEPLEGILGSRPARAEVGRREARYVIIR